MEFPGDMVTFLKDEALQLELVTKAYGRRLRETDPSGSVGVAAVDWIPRDSNIGQHEPVVATYLFVVESFIKHANEEEGNKSHTALAKQLRHMLYRDQGFRVRLAQNMESTQGTIERVQRWGVRQQRYQANELQGQFLFLSVTELWIEVEATVL